MKYCPHCRKPSVQASGACPHCGKDLDVSTGQTTDTPTGGYEALTGSEFEDDGSSLELDTSYTPPPGSLPPGSIPPGPGTAPPYTPPPEPASLNLGPSGGGPSLELDAPAGSHPPSTPPPSSVGSFRRGPVIPDFSSKEEDIVEYDPDELEEVAKFGKTPSGLFDAINYALRVRKRVVELKDEATRLETSLDQAKRDLIEELARLGERARVAGYRSKSTSVLLAAVEQADRNAESAQDAIQAEERRHRQKIAEIEAGLDELRTRMEQPRLRESKLSGHLAQFEEQRRQIEMRLKRIEIEIRNGENLIAQAQQAQQDPEAQESRQQLFQSAAQAQSQLPQLQGQRQQLRAQNAQLDEPISEYRGQLAQAREVLNQLKTERTALKDQREGEEKFHLSNRQGASSQSENAKQEAQSRLAEVGRALRYDGNAPEWAKEIFPTVDQRADSFNRIKADHQKFLQAVNCYDQGSVKKGYAIMIGGAGTVALIIITLLALAVFLT